MESQNINLLATIATRFSEVNSAAKTTKLAIQDLRFKIFADLVSPEELDALEKAQRIIESITSNTSQNDAIKYYNKTVNGKSL